MGNDLALPKAEKRGRGLNWQRNRQPLLQALDPEHFEGP
jgi:hypothetical protein